MDGLNEGSIAAVKKNCNKNKKQGALVIPREWIVNSLIGKTKIKIFEKKKSASDGD